jgi:2,4-dienoyl-CoA reductase-like NADH-dependent reductase (Old Yellow Enzyme family)
MPRKKKSLSSPLVDEFERQLREKIAQHHMDTGVSFTGMGREIAANPSLVTRFMEGEGTRLSTLRRIEEYIEANRS